MARNAFAGPTPSPPHSGDGRYNMGDDNRRAVVKPEPFTPPLTSRSLISDIPPPLAFDPYGDPSLYHTAPAHVYCTPQQTMVTSVPSHRTSHRLANDGIQTRSGRALGTPSSPGDTESTRASQSPRPRARRNLTKKANSKGGPVIDQPLSVLTKDYETPVRDMSAWVNRSVEERMAEIDRKKGYIARPMNSFMLYRSAYADRVKQFCKENNHQVVSQVTGASWPLEPKEIRELYERLAIVERDNHQAAHPNYKFAPNKAGKRPRNGDDESDSDPEWEGSTKNSKHSRNARRVDSRSTSSTPFEDRPARYQRPMPALHLSGFEVGHPYGAPPLMTGPNGIVGEYYQASAFVEPYDQVGDLKFERIEDPFPSYQTSMGPVGVPNAGHHELLTSYPAPQLMAIPAQNDVLDPRLDHIDPNYQLAYFGEGMEPTQEIPRTIAYETVSQFEVGYQPEAYHPGLATLTEEHDVWGESGRAGSDFDSEFQKLS
ncbi:uncharacterized protein Z518_05535 [Rhinocladiella mackenziei CBS 650.93]|uniref:HMG box domain-containing protein n=1 Tax=Rhinocladiella mackenziei CBS 650.93 TaxID=1442369 RepID=A0A0D2J6J2_9EURO|nr:uncharacterized protein Z518_05535 [Rhinocladiella mackenziei CBS 650.93]KIX04665.1 hypothetical protein Z518_05535 [Rhinocladiella mackenziei CBS 650.93]